MNAHLYSDDELLMLSGIQHFKFCPRQWALIHVEQQWQDNHLTLQGDTLHRKVDQPLNLDFREGVLRIRAVPLISRELGLSGIADVVELTCDDDSENTVTLPGHHGRWRVAPVEYKHGRPKRDRSDEVQLCAQAICFEEMYNIIIPHGYIFYAATRSRKTIEFNDELRQLVKTLAEEMHRMIDQGITPPANYEPKCKSCSLNDLCMINDLQRVTTVSHYLKQLTISDEETA